MSFQPMSSIIYQGLRGPPFKALITKLMERSKLKKKFIDVLTSDENMKLFSKAFTAASADPKNNYEIYEQLGDLSANKFIVWYAYRRFPQLRCPLGVKVVARLRINYGSKQSFSSIAEKLEFWPYISAAEEGTDRSAKYRSRHKKDLLEDVLEAFIGCTEEILDDEYVPGVGYAIVYDILASIFDDIPISLRFEDLIDAKTRMKEIFDSFGQTIGSYQFIDTREERGHHSEMNSVAVSKLYRVPHGAHKRPTKTTDMDGNSTLRANRGWILIGEGEGTTKSNAQQQASEEGIITLNRAGYIKEVPIEYQLFCR
jgi:dsRNA-specific ribonuclease